MATVDPHQDLEVQRLRATIAKLEAEVHKLKAESTQINRHTFWYPVVIAGGFIGGTAAITTLLIKLVLPLLVPSAPAP